MQLKFTTKFPKKKPGLKGAKTWFAEKIIKGLETDGHKINPHDFKYLMNWMVVNKKFDFPFFLNLPKNHKGKIHTLREDKIGKWNEGDQIDMMMNDGIKELFRFLPPIPCKGIQLIKIEYFMGCGSFPNVYVDGVVLSDDQFTELCVNDGFDTPEQFCQYFDKDWKGKIVHWTDFKYNQEEVKKKDVCRGGCGDIKTACEKCLKEFEIYKSKQKKS